MPRTDPMRFPTDTPGKLRSALSVALARVVIPMWLGVGAVLKLADGSPGNLPASLVKWFGGFGMDLRFVLEFSIAVELIVVGVMVLLPRLARPVGIVMLGSFLPVLIGDVALGAASCGCFGAMEIHPGITLAMDLSFFLALIFLARGVSALAMTTTLPTRRVAAAGVWSLLSVAAAFGLTHSGAPSAASARVDGRQGVVGPEAGYYLPDYSSWQGVPFVELELASWIRGLPADLVQGSQLILFYRKDCEHCHELMEVFFADRPPLPTTAVAVPEKAGFPTDNLQPVVCAGCGLAELPAGVDWFLQTPVLVRLEDGIVACAAEVTAENPLCLDVF